MWHTCSLQLHILQYFEILMAELEFASFRTGGVGIGRSIKQIERNEYMGFENICS
jgi:hypothetical protein